MGFASDHVVAYSRGWTWWFRPQDTTFLFKQTAPERLLQNSIQPVTPTYLSGGWRTIKPGIFWNQVACKSMDGCASGDSPSHAISSISQSGSQNGCSNSKKILLFVPKPRFLIAAIFWEGSGGQKKVLPCSLRKPKEKEMIFPREDDTKCSCSIHIQLTNVFLTPNIWGNNKGKLQIQKRAGRIYSTGHEVQTEASCDHCRIFLLQGS